MWRAGGGGQPIKRLRQAPVAPLAPRPRRKNSRAAEVLQTSRNPASGTFLIAWPTKSEQKPVAGVSQMRTSTLADLREDHCHHLGDKKEIKIFLFFWKAEHIGLSGAVPDTGVRAGLMSSVGGLQGVGFSKEANYTAPGDLWS